MKKLVIVFVIIFSVGCTSLQGILKELNSSSNPSRQFEVKTAWIRPTTQKENHGFRKVNRMTPQLVGDLVIQGNGIDGLVAFDRETGHEKWRLAIENGVEPSAALIKDRLFVGASDGNFYSISASTGKVEWSFATHTENLSAPLLIDGVIYFLAGNNHFYALDAASGKQLWLYTRQDTSQFSIRGGGQAAFKSGILYVGFSDGSLVALNAKNGTLVWDRQLNRNKKFRDIDATPVIDQDQLFIAGYDDRLYCLSLETGEIQWRIDGGAYSSVTLLGDKIIYPTSTGEVSALKKSNGEKLWTYKLKEGIATQVKPYKGFLVFGESQGMLRFLDANSGTSIAGIEPGRGILASPQIDEKNGRVYFISGEGNLFAIDAAWVNRPLL